MWQESEKFLLKDKYIGPLIRKYGACRIKPSKANDYFADLVQSIVLQQLSIKAGNTIYHRVKEKLGGEVVPDRILATKDIVFRKCGMSFSKIKYIKDLSMKVKEGELNISKLSSLPDEEVANELIKVKGIGRWTADMFLMFTLARPDIFPVDDMGIQSGMKRLLKKENLKPEKMVEFAKRWAPFRTVASWYLWEIIDN